MQTETSAPIGLGTSYYQADGGRGRQLGLPSPHPGLCPQFPSALFKRPHALGGRKSPETARVPRVPPWKRRGTVTKSWGSPKVLGIPELSKPPTPWAKCPLRGLWMGPDLTVAACPSSPGSQQSPHSRCCCLLAGPSRESCDRAAENPSPAGPACPSTCMQRLIRALSPSSHTQAPGLSS